MHFSKRERRSLKESNIEFIEHQFDDHHPFCLSDIHFDDGLAVVMTAKDAVKCQKILKESDLNESQQQSFWYLPIEAQLPNRFFSFMFDRLNITMKIPDQNFGI